MSEKEKSFEYYLYRKAGRRPAPFRGGMNAVPNAIELERNRYLVRDP